LTTIRKRSPARELRRRCFPEDPTGASREAPRSIRDYLAALCKFDVYSWGVLHHTGSMWQALENAILPVRSGGLLFIAIYNDQGGVSGRWASIKRAYVRHRLLRGPIIAWSFAYLFGSSFLKNLLRGRPLQSFKSPAAACPSGTTWSIGSAAILSKSPAPARFSSSSNTGLPPHAPRYPHSLGCNEFVFERTC
jgi:2-polyprenyl-6-hydroxyphenyl methylase/3-demethylubiquinone-9 3-methyltransferase